MNLYYTIAKFADGTRVTACFADEQDAHDYADLALVCDESRALEHVTVIEHNPSF